MTMAKERELMLEASGWIQRLLDRDAISLDCDRTDSTPTGEDEMEYTINLAERLRKAGGRP